jgi:serine/threonine protein kinase
VPAAEDRPENPSSRAYAGAPIATRYELMEKIGEGGMGSVYRARQIATNRIVAIKFLSEQFIEDDVRRARFEQEARAASSLYHPNLVYILDFGCDENLRPYLVLEYIPGIGLDQMLKQKKHLNAHELIEIFCQICRGLAHVHHKGIVHRDLKPSNVMVINDEAGEVQVKIVDFGIAKQERPQSITQTGELLGSPLYMSPEQAMGNQVDARSDIYSVGCMLFEAATGRAPFVGENAIATLVMRLSHDPPTFEQVAPYAGLSAELERVIMRALKRDVSQRYQTIAALQADLRELEQVHPKPSGTLQGLRTLRAQRTAAIAPNEERARAGIATAMVAILAATVLGGAYFFSQGKAKTTTVSAAKAAVTARAPQVVAQASTAKPVPKPTSEDASATQVKAKEDVPVVATKPKIIPLPADIQADLEEEKAEKEQKAQQPQIRYIYVAQNGASSVVPGADMLPPPQMQPVQRIRAWQRNFDKLMSQANDQRSHNDFTNAAITYEQAIAILRNHGAEMTQHGAAAHNRRGECLAAMGRSSEASQEYEFATRISSSM